MTETRPFKVSYRHSRKPRTPVLPQPDEEQERRKAQREAKIEREVKQAAKDYREQSGEPYAYERRTMSPIDFAKAVLAGQLFTHHGHLWLDGQYATPSRIFDYANAKLARMGLEPVAMWKRP